MDIVNPFDVGKTPTASTQGSVAPSTGLNIVNPLATAAGQALHVINPLDAGDSPSIGGFVGNLLGDVKDMVTGLGNIIGQGVHDALLLAHGPSSLDHPEDFQLFQTAKALPGALAKDYSSRYGWDDFSHGDIWGGLSSIGHGLYNDPLSYVGDALMVGKGLELGAKAGIIGGDAGTKVLGVTAEEAAAGLRPVQSAATMTGASAETVPLQLSLNPAARLLQSKLYSKLFQYTPEKAANWAALRNPAFGASTADVGLYARAETGLKLAEAEGIKVLRPTVSKAIESHGMSKVLSHLGVTVEDATSAATRSIIDQVHTLDPEGQSTLVDVLQGTTPVDAPLVRPSMWSIDPEFESQYNAPFQPITEVRDQAVARAVSENFDRGSWSMLPDGARTGMPHDMNGMLGTRIQIVSADATLADAPGIIRKLAGDTDSEILAVKNGFADNGSWDGYVAQLRTRDGNIFEAHVGTPTSFAEQARWSHTATKIEAMKAELAGDDVTLAQRDPATGLDLDTGEPLPPPMSPVARMQLEDNLDAAEAMNDRAFAFTRRSQAAALGGLAYDARAQVADSIRATTYNIATTRAVDAGMSYRTLWDRAFLPQRSTRWTDLMQSVETDLKKVFDDTKAAGGGEADSIDAALAVLDRHFGPGHPATVDALKNAMFDSNVNEVIPFTTSDVMPAALDAAQPALGGTLATGERTILSDGAWWGPSGAGDTAAGAKFVTDKLRRMTHASIVENGEFPSFTWKDMLLDAEANPLGEVPQYFPHLRKSTFSAEKLWLNNRKSVLNSETNRMVKSEGELFEAAMYERDPIQAYSRLYREVVKHTEYKDVLLDGVRKYGREVTPEELQAVALRGLPTGERYISESGINALTEGRKEFMVLKHEGMMDGLDATAASQDAITQMSDAALAAVRERLAGGGTVTENVWAIPEHVAKQFDKVGREYLKLPTKASFFYGTVMQGWKTSVLGLSPRWIVNNTLGNLVYMGVKDPAAIRYYVEMMMPERRAFVEEMFGPSVSKAVYRDFMHGEMTREIPLAEKAAQAGMPQFAQRLDNLSQSRLGFLAKGPVWLARKVYHFNEWNEQAARMGMAISEAQRVRMVGAMGKLESSYGAMRSIMERGALSEGEITSVVNKVDATLGAYLSLSPAEKMIKQYFAPFYPFYRHTALFLAKMPFENPAKFRVLSQIAEIDKEMRPGLPEYRRGSYEVAPGLWVSLGAANPLEAVTQAYAPAITNPLLGLAIQRVTGTNPFGQAWVAPGKVFETRSGQKYEILRNPDGSYAGVQPVTGSWEPPLTETVLSMVPQFGLLTGITPFKPKPWPMRAAGFAGVSMSQGPTAQEYQMYQALHNAEALTQGAREYGMNP